MRALLFLSLLLPAPAWATSVHVRFYATADNCYGVYTGTEWVTDGDDIGHDANQSSINGIRQAEVFDRDFELQDYVYVAAWSDNSAWQGAMVYMEGVETAGPWEVYATGQSRVCDSDAAAPPSGAEVSQQILIANLGLGGTGTSGTWQPVVTGPTNGSAPWGTVHGPDPDNGNTEIYFPTSWRWMWYDAGVGGTGVFDDDVDEEEYLLFRIPVREVGACCYEGAAEPCEQMDEGACSEKPGGVWYDDMEDCATVCEDGLGACCLDDTCEDTSQARCDAAGGVFYAGRSCDDEDVVCCEPTGACCMDDSCAEISELSCCTLGGTFLGAGLSCEGHELECCEADHCDAPEDTGVATTSSTARTAGCGSALAALFVPFLLGLRRRS